MKGFVQHLAEGKNTHLEHVEDIIFNEGSAGLKQTISFLKMVGDTFSSNVKNPVNITTKWDGAPAIFAGYDPRDGKFFVAKKGIFNKEPDVYKHTKDLLKLDNKELAQKFTWALKEFPKLGIKKGEVIQGDLMFTKGDVKKEKVGGEDLYTIQPNTIVYAFPTNSTLGKQIYTASIGVVWHTLYKGDSFETMKASFGQPISKKLKQISSVWHDDATYKDVSGSITFTKAESELFDSTIHQIELLARKINTRTLDYIANNKMAMQLIKTFNNSIVRAGEPFPNPRKHARDAYSFVHERMQKEIDKMKSAAGKKKKEDLLKDMVKNIFQGTDLVRIYELFNHLVWAKEILLKRLNKGQSMKMFIRTNAGLKVTNHEGFVAVDHVGNAVKIVDRLEFSKSNFSPNVIKGWQR